MERSRRKESSAPARDEAALVFFDPAPEPRNAEEARTMGEGAYVKLRSDLIGGRIAPGSRLPFRQLSAQYQVGIGPLREALVRLASEHLVEFEGQRGFVVAPLSIADLKDLTERRIELTCQALRLSIAQGDETWEDNILVALHRLLRSQRPNSTADAQTIDEWERRHDRFHTSLVAACGSKWLLHFCTVLSDHFQRYRRFIVASMSESAPLFDDIRQQHSALAEAALDRRADDAVALLKGHFEGSLAQVLGYAETIAGRKRA
ncbi:MAG TPA: FCD domain-containing protein [Stellaceae bacterium]|nr:FCD domain-containing protein [Stellaceae bacterium]